MDPRLSLPTVGKNISDLEEAGLVVPPRKRKIPEGAVQSYMRWWQTTRGDRCEYTNRHISAVAIDLQGTVVAHTRFRQAFA